jgi:hypothetical protein
MFSELAGNGDFSTLSNMLGSSEGENISNSIGYFLTPLREFIKTGVYKEQGKFSKLHGVALQPNTGPYRLFLATITVPTELFVKRQ